MNKLIVILLALIITSCSTTKDCTCSVKRDYFVVQDTLTIPSYHEHIYEDDSTCFCLYIEESQWPIEDTIWYEYE